MLWFNNFRGKTFSLSFVLKITCLSLAVGRARAGFLSQPTVFFKARQLTVSPSFLHDMFSSENILESPSAERNKTPIWEILQSKVFKSSTDSQRPLQILEIAAGSGVHTIHFARMLKAAGVGFRWIPTDPDEPSRQSIEARLKVEQDLLPLVSPAAPLTLDSGGICEKETQQLLPDSLDIMMAINMIHIAPWSATEGLMRVAGSKLKTNGVLFLYGPYKVGGSCVESNL
jgi:hypothetical protein